MASHKQQRMRRTDGRRRTQAFTLIELLVVVAIIALLISILLPSLKRAREQAKMVASTANLKGIGTAGITYAASDSKEMTIPVHRLMGLVEGAVGTYEYGGKSGAGEPLQGNDAVDSKWGTQNGRGPATRGLNPIVYKGGFTDYQNLMGPNRQNWRDDANLDLGIFKDPSDKGYAGHHYVSWQASGLTSYDHYGTSYSAVTSWIGRLDGDCQLESNSSFLKPISRVPNPANTLYFMENAGRFGYRANSGLNGCGGGASGSLGSDVLTVIKGWHGRAYTFQVSFVDGHAGTVRMEGHQVPAPVLGRYPSGAPCCCPNGGEGAACHTCWRCVIFRGRGWQIDTLPAPSVVTNIGCDLGAVINPIG